MDAKTETFFRNATVRHYIRVVAFVLLGACVGAFSMWILLNASSFQLAHVPESLFQNISDSDMSSFSLTHATPTQIRIPSVDIEVPFARPLGVNEDKTIEVPDSFEDVGWYKYGPTPGEIGPSVVLGHVDSYKGPAVFWPLRHLKAGDQIFIDRIDGTTATFTVERLEEYAQSGFPTDAVYGDLDYAGLRLITCSGIYNHGTLRYSHNLIVFARLLKDSLEHSGTIEES